MSDEHDRDIGRFEAQIEALFGAVIRIEKKLDETLTLHDGRLRDVEGEIRVLRRIGTAIAVIWGSAVAGIAWLFQRTP